jgi:hypothetical protein
MWVITGPFDTEIGADLSFQSDSISSCLVNINLYCGRIKVAQDGKELCARSEGPAAHRWKQKSLSRSLFIQCRRVYSR